MTELYKEMIEGFTTLMSKANNKEDYATVFNCMNMINSLKMTISDEQKREEIMRDELKSRIAEKQKEQQEEKSWNAEQAE